MGSDEKYGVGPGRLSGQGSKNINEETSSPREGWGVVLPLPGGGDEGGRDGADSDIDPPEAEHGRKIYCNAAYSGPVRGGSKTDGCTGPKAVVGADGDRLEGAREKAAVTEEAAETALTGSASESEADTPDGTASSTG